MRNVMTTWRWIIFFVAASCCPAANQPAWDVPTTLSTNPSFDYAGPAFDQHGNAWLFVLDTSLRAFESDGDGGWLSPQTLETQGQGFELEGPGAIAIDSTGVVHGVYRNISANGEYQLVWVTHSPGTSWQGPTVIYSSPYFFENISITTDSAQDLIVVFDRSGNQTLTPQAWSIVYTHSTGKWGQAEPISPAGEPAYLQTLARSPDGSVVLLVYITNQGAGVYYQNFAVSSQTWSSPTTIPGTNHASFGLVGVGARYPLTVDNKGNATLVVALYTLPQGNYYEIQGFRYEGGIWQAGATLLPWTPASFGGSDLFDFNGIAQDAAGDVLCVNSFYSAQNLNYEAYRFTTGTGWDTELVARLPNNDSESRASVAWFESVGEAVATYIGSHGLHSKMYINGAWSYSPVIPGSPYHGPGLITTAPNGEVLMTINGNPNGTGLLATWLRP